VMTDHHIRQNDNEKISNILRITKMGPRDTGEACALWEWCRQTC
jgi:hypothetical protein